MLEEGIERSRDRRHGTDMLDQVGARGLGGLGDALVVELDALALRALLAVPVGLLEALLGGGLKG